MGNSIGLNLQSAIAKKASVGFLVFDSSNMVVFCNDIMEHYTGFKPEELVSTPFFDIVLEGEKYLEFCRKKLENLPQHPLDDLDIPIIKKTGDKAILHIIGSSFEEEGARYSLLVVEDITRKREYDKVIESVYDGLMQSTIDLDAEVKSLKEQRQVLEDYKVVAGRMLVEIENEIASAADIQRKLLPLKLPKIKNAEIEVLYEPVRKVSGDYYDVFHLKGGKIGIVICDVAGIGVPAAFVMIMIRAIVHLIASSDREVDTMLTWVNRGVSGEIDIEHFATMSMLTFDSKREEIAYSNAGQNPLLVFRKSTGRLESVDTEGFPIGIIGTAEYGKKKLRVSKGDIIALFTNGIIQAVNENNELYSIERVSKMIETNSGRPLKEIIKEINKDIHSFVGNARQHSDKTLILMKFDEESGSKTDRAGTRTVANDLEEIEECTDEEWNDVYRNLVQEIVGRKTKPKK